MSIISLSDKILLPDKRDVIRIHIYAKLFENGIKPIGKDVDVLLEFYLFGGYSSSQEQNRFFELCLEKKLKRSHHSVRNTLSKYKNLNVLRKQNGKRNFLSINEEFLPLIPFDKLVLQHTISHHN